MEPLHPVFWCRSNRTNKELQYASCLPGLEALNTKVQHHASTDRWVYFVINSGQRKKEEVLSLMSRVSDISRKKITVPFPAYSGADHIFGFIHPPLEIPYLLNFFVSARSSSIHVYVKIKPLCHFNLTRKVEQVKRASFWFKVMARATRIGF